jgi:hypothetical protein
MIWEKQWSEQVAKQAVWLSGLVPYRQAAEILQTVGQITISSTSIWRRVQRWRSQMQSVAARQQVKAYELAEPPSPDPNRSLGKMGVAMDGTMIHLATEGWKELKVSCVFEIAARIEKVPQTNEEVTLGSAVNNTYTAHLGGPEPFGRQIWAEARQRNWMQATDSLAIGDGALWIWNLVSEHFYASHQLFDWFHATEHLAAAAHLLYHENSPKHRTWYRRWSNQLYLSHGRKLVTALKSQATRQPDKAELLRQQAKYFQNNLKRMNYLEMRMEGYPIGSGMVESAAKQYKGRGMRWSRTGAERLLPVRTAILSKRFDKTWCLAYNSPPN